nr:MAG TPA: hypothetical protein [Caudoviricetes sp.]
MTIIVGDGLLLTVPIICAILVIRNGGGSLWRSL